MTTCAPPPPCGSDTSSNAESSAGSDSTASSTSAASASASAASVTPAFTSLALTAPAFASLSTDSSNADTGGSGGASTSAGTDANASASASANAAANASAAAGAGADTSGAAAITPATITPAAATQSEIVGLFYQGVLDRAPDAAGEAYWMADLRAGQPLPVIGNEFLACPEPQSMGFGTMSNQQFVATLYQNALGRAPDAAGLTAWMNDLAAGDSRGAVAAGICDSQEAYARQFAQGAFVYPV